MEIISYAGASEYLNYLFELVNERYFNNELEIPVITIQSTPRAYGHYTLSDVWSVKEQGFREINIGAGGLNRPIENVISTLIHECVHYYCDINSIQDCSNRGIYHNKRFKAEAEKRGLVIGKHDTYGWTLTFPSEELKQWIAEMSLTDIEIARKDWIPADNGKKGGDLTGGKTGTDSGGQGKRKTSTRKYCCLICGISVRATKELNIMCMDCMEKMEVVEKKN